ncbi:MAG: glyoxylate/hydroxypyruvate reductase A [Ectothiorhodospiraceae bacterium]|nr:glyoxylate/hydroxypyruvate reductase A [Chromatiales bacterium]MCP5155467.1 glyoxylate/hydroxypyruvate reductase A [Ectothiorhodospiraceae bacterium]
MFASATREPGPWKAALDAALPAYDVRVWPEVGAPDDVRYVLLWKPPAGLLGTLPNLEVAFSLGAGVDGLVDDPELPPGIPLVKMGEPGLVEGMWAYVLYHVLRYHRRMPEYEAQQARREWRELDQRPHRACRVGIMGLGRLGAATATRLAALDFDVAGWSRSPHRIEGVTCHHGDAGLDAFLRRTDILVCLLPLTEQTRGIIGARTIARLPRGAVVINAARGGHQVEDELVAALDSGHLSAATLDVFATEPLPAAHPLWAHPRVTITPHVASITDPVAAALEVAENVRRHEAGEPMAGVVDRSLGY